VFPLSCLVSWLMSYFKLNNDDHCSSCRSHGDLVYCDGCPRAFHLWCVDPPLESIEEGDSRWFCPACAIRKVGSPFSLLSCSPPYLSPATSCKASTFPFVAPHPSAQYVNPGGVSVTRGHPDLFQRRCFIFLLTPNFA